MNGLIRASLKNPYAVTVMALTMILLGVIAVISTPVDILPVFKSPAVQVLTFYGGMPAIGIEKDITNRMERWVGQSNGMKRQESRSIVGASIVRNYFQEDVDPNGALTQVNSLALAAVPNLPPGTLPPVVLPFDPTSTTPVALVALNSKDPANTESILYDVGRYEVRNMIMSNPGAVAPVVFGGKLRAVMIYLDRQKMQARRLSPLDVMKSLDAYNLFLPTGDAKFGTIDYAIDSNSMYELVKRMGDIPLRTEHGNAGYIRDVGTPTDAAFIQTNIVRVDGKKQVYIPVFRQLGSSTLTVVGTLKDQIKGMQERLSRGGIDLKVVMDQSVYVRKSIEALVQEGVLGAVLCSLVILMFLGDYRMTLIAIFTLPISVLCAVVCLYFTGNTINVMTLAGLSLAIGPMVDSAIICLENTHRHMGLGATPEEASFLGASEVALPELVSTLCTFLVLTPLIFVPGLGQFLFKPMTLAVAFAMCAAYLLSRTFVPAFSAILLKPHAAAHGPSQGQGHDHAPGHDAVPANPKGQAAGHGFDDDGGFQIGNGNGDGNGHGHAPRGNMIARAFARWERLIDRGIAVYVRGLNAVLRNRILTMVIAYSLLAGSLAVFSPILRREFFPEADAGAFEMAVRAPSGTRIEVTNQRIAEVEEFVRKEIPKHDLELIISELGVTPDWSAAYTPNAGPMDANVKIQLTAERTHSAQEYVLKLRHAIQKEARFADLEFSFDAGGMVRGAMNEGKSTPLNVRVTGKNQGSALKVAEAIRDKVVKINGVVDARIIQRLNYPEYVINVDRAKAADLGLNQEEIMRNIVASLNSSISFNKRNFWIDPVSHNQYFVGVQYPEQDIQSVETLLDVVVTGTNQKSPVPLRNIATLTRTSVPTEINHYNLQPTIDLSMGVEGRDLGHISDDVNKAIGAFGKLRPDGAWDPYDPAKPGAKERLKGAKIVLSGEYTRMQETFKSLFQGLILASILMYFLMVGLDKSWLVPLTVMSVVPISLAGVLPMLYFTHTALNVQSLLGIIFIVGIKVANTVLMTDYAQELRKHEGLSPTEAIRKAASIRVRPVTMTALAAFFAMIPGALAIERGSEANAPLARAILGGLMAGEPATLFVLPAFYSLLIRDPKGTDARQQHVPETQTDPDPNAGWA